jgi:hypothetical protein
MGGNIFQYEINVYIHVHIFLLLDQQIQMVGVDF